MARQAIISTLSLLAIVGSLGGIYLTEIERQPKINVKPYQALGQRVAEETAKLLGRKGRLVVLIADIGNFKIPALQAQTDAFEKTLKARGDFTIIGVKKFKMSPMGLVQFNSGELVGPSFPLAPEEFDRFWEGYSDVDALISFVGVPPLAELQLAQIRMQLGKVIIVSSLYPTLKNLLAVGLIDRAIVTRWQSPPAKKPKTLEDWFDQHYVVLRPENAAALR